MDFVGKAFVVEWAFSVGWASDWEEIPYWLSNCTGAGDIGKWSCKGFVGTVGTNSCIFFFFNISWLKTVTNYIFVFFFK